MFQILELSLWLVLVNPSADGCKMFFFPSEHMVSSWLRGESPPKSCCQALMRTLYFQSGQLLTTELPKLLSALLSGLSSNSKYSWLVLSTTVDTKGVLREGTKNTTVPEPEPLKDDQRQRLRHFPRAGSKHRTPAVHGVQPTSLPGRILGAPM